MWQQMFHFFYVHTHTHTHPEACLCEQTWAFSFFSFFTCWIMISVLNAKPQYRVSSLESFCPWANTELRIYPSGTLPSSFLSLCSLLKRKNSRINLFVNVSDTNLFLVSHSLFLLVPSSRKPCCTSRVSISLQLIFSDVSLFTHFLRCWASFLWIFPWRKDRGQGHSALAELFSRCKDLTSHFYFFVFIVTCSHRPIRRAVKIGFSLKKQSKHFSS